MRGDRPPQGNEAGKGSAQTLRMPPSERVTAQRLHHRARQGLGSRLCPSLAEDGEKDLKGRGWLKVGTLGLLVVMQQVEGRDTRN